MTIEKISRYQQKRIKLTLGGEQKHQALQHSQGKLTVRERIELLFDEKTFVELEGFMIDSLLEPEGEELTGERIVAGYGQVDNRLVYAYAQDFTASSGAMGKLHALKIARIQDLALKVGAPIVGLVDSGGARIQEGVDILTGYGQIFYRNTLSSGVIPQITAVMGPCLGGAAYGPSLTDFVFMVAETGCMFVNGPQVIQAETGKEATLEGLGGAMAHNQVSGVAHFLASDDQSCIAEIRRLLSFLPSNHLENTPSVQRGADVNRLIPELDEIIPDGEAPYDMKQIIRLIADQQDFLEIQPYFAPNILTGLLRLNGQTVGLVANQPQVLDGKLTIDAANKASRFIRTCDCFNIPVLSLVDVPGFLADQEQEQAGLIRHGAKLFYAYSEATVPKITLVVRRAYGGAGLAMGSKEMGADLVFAWPTAEIAAMTPAGAAAILFRNEIIASAEPKEVRAQKIQDYQDRYVTPYHAAARGLIDDIFEPSATCPRLADAFHMLHNKREFRPRKKHGNLPL